MILALVLSIAALNPVTRVIPERRYEAQLVKVVDGDTVIVRIAVPTSVHLPGMDIETTTSVVESVRLAGMNAPELSAPQCDKEKALAEKARAVLESKLKGAKLELVTRGSERDKYARVLADIEADGLSVSRHLIDAGLADPYDGGKRSPDRWCH